MELRITNPQENWLTEQILWNNEELKAAIAEKVKDYKTIAYTEDSLKDMKADRADLNKLKKAFEDERKRVKKICMEPYTKFEQQVKEITALIDEPIGLIDSQIREIDERRKTVKREEIEELFTSIGFQSFVKLDISKLGICEFFCLLFILYELVSILKNMTLCGLPVPSGVKKWIQKFLEDMTEELPEDAVKNIEIKTEPRTEGE